MSDLAKAHDRLQKLYARIWQVWYDGVADVAPAPLIVEQGTHAPGYLHGTIYLFLDGYDLEAAANDPEHDAVGEFASVPSWQRDLIHEMMHEFQDKFAKHAVSEAGRDLHAKYAKRFPGPGHDEAFFTAIEIQAEFFGLTPEQLVIHL